MERHFHHSSGDPDHSWRSWTHGPGSESSQQVSLSQTTTAPLLQVPTTISLNISSILEPTSPPCDRTSVLTPDLPSSSQSFTSGASSTVQIAPDSFSTQANSPISSPPTLIASTSPGKVLAASFSSTSTSTVFDIITTSSPSPTPPSSTSPPTDLPTTPNQQPSFFNRISTDAKVGFLLGILFLLLFFIVLSIYLCTRQKRRARLFHASYPAAMVQRPISYAQETRALTSSTPEPYLDIEVIPAGVPKTSMDSAGIRWPEAVVLVGDAKEVREWTEEYEKCRKDECCERRALEIYGF